MITATYDYENPQSNIVDGETLKKIQQNVLRDMRTAILRSMGPAGSNTLIIEGNNPRTADTKYTKDGNKIVKNIQYANPIEMSIQVEIANITSHIERTVGDGTSSAVVLSSLIFDELINSGKYSNGDPYQVTRDFKQAVEAISAGIASRGRKCTLEDIYNIAYISTNGNADLAYEIRKIYEERGMNVFIDVSASMNENSYSRSYDGLTLDVGYSDAAYVNSLEGCCRLSNPRIYAFEDPIDTAHMSAFFEKIILTNVIKTPKPIPTVVIAPRISRDQSGFIRKIINQLYQYPDTDYSQKPPILVITNIDGISVNHYQHIAQLCGCKMIRKYIDPKNEEHDQEAGIAPTLENVVEFYGTATQVEADEYNTKFGEPAKMYQRDEDGKILEKDGVKVFGTEYTNIINFLTAEMKRAQESESTGAGVVGSLKRQLNALKANMVEYFVGGISIADRDSLRDLVEDAVLNCRSAALNGVGFGACFEGWYASEEVAETQHGKVAEYAKLIHDAYTVIMKKLYGMTYEEEFIESMLQEMAEADPSRGPINITTGTYDQKVLTSIDSDIVILDTISKIVTTMFVSNQVLLPSANINMYK